MSDNITAPASGVVFASDDIGGVQYPRTKLVWGAEGSAVDASSANPVPVAGNVGVTGNVAITAGALPLPAGASTETTLAALSAKLPASTGAKAASGSLSVVPATSAEFPITAAALPLPAGAATSAKQDSAATILAAVQAAVEGAQPARNAFAIVPHDVNPLAILPRAVRVNVAGTVTFRAVDGTADVTVNALAGELISVRMSHIRATGTTATGLVGLA